MAMRPPLGAQPFTFYCYLMISDVKGIHFVSITQGINTATTEGRIFFGQLALFAEYERELIRQRTKAGMEAVQRRGKHIGRPHKLSNEELNAIFHMKSQGQLTHEIIAKQFDISPRTLSLILNDYIPNQKKCSVVTMRSLSRVYHENLLIFKFGLQAANIDEKNIKWQLFALCGR